ncbi:MAG: molybdate ABC transporter substrate-binding protein [Planctomycetota bacterium]|nr:molybdate ABC transporter substrate-binding protein [Planctomycetota bacterium]
MWSRFVRQVFLSLDDQSVGTTRCCSTGVVLWVALFLTGCQPAATQLGPNSTNQSSASDANSEVAVTETGDSAHPAASGTVRIAAASDLRFAFEELAKEFARIEPQIELQVTFGSSGAFFAQLSNEAPFDLFLSADIDFPRKLIAQGQGIANSEFTYGVGELVLWVRNDSPLKPQEGGMRVLADPRAAKIAIANPDHAPYGRAAVAALKSLELYESVKDRLVLAENVSQAVQWVDTGAADVGLVAASLVTAPALRDKGDSFVVPADSYPPLVQGGVILNWAKAPGAAERFRVFLMSEAGQAILNRYGIRNQNG